MASGLEWRSSVLHWGIVSKLIHWLMAIMIIGMLVIGVIMTRMDFSEVKFEIYQLHKSFGLTLMVLALIRLFWRGSSMIPPLPTEMPGWQRVCSHISHVALYGFMFAMPLTGWLMVSASPLSEDYPTIYFGLFEVPSLVGIDEDFSETMESVHAAFSIGFAAVLLVHVAAALKHHLVDKDTILTRMLPGRPG